MGIISDKRARAINPNFGSNQVEVFKIKPVIRRTRRPNRKHVISELPDPDHCWEVSLPDCTHGRLGLTCWRCDVIRRKTAPCEHRVRKDRCRLCPGGRKVWAARLLGGVKGRAKRKGIPFDLTISWILTRLEKGCPVFKRHFEVNSKVSDWSPSIDRFDPKLGYTKTNCFVISMLANRIKTNTVGSEQVFRVAQWMKKVEDLKYYKT